MGKDGANGRIVNNTISRNSRHPKMVLIPGNFGGTSFRHYKANSTGVQRPFIQLNDFYLAATETTRGQYACFLSAIDLTSALAAVDWAEMVKSPAPIASLSGVTVAQATGLRSNPNELVAGVQTRLLSTSTTFTSQSYMVIGGTAGSRSEVYFPGTVNSRAYAANSDESTAVNNPVDPLRRDNFPMIYVSWYGALAFSVWFGGALPSEAQWEYAARMTSQGALRTFKYAGSNTLNDVAWSGANSGSKDHEVGTLLPTGMGLYDMTGNADEWCLDWCNTNGGAYDNVASSWNRGSGSGDGKSAGNPLINPVYNIAHYSSPRPRRGGNLFDLNVNCHLGYRSCTDAPTYMNGTTSFRVAVAAALALPRQR
jgi:formylglycine-generating enzyme required for sulfatase activity